MAAILNLGCGNEPVEGAVHHDLTRHADWVDVGHDLEITPWPWADGTFDQVMAQDLLEHLHLGFIGFFDECWRILKPGGVVRVRTPMWNSLNAVIDPTHVRCYHPESFHYLDPRTGWGQKYGFYTARKWQIEQLGIDLVNIHAVLRKVDAGDASAALSMTTGGGIASAALAMTGAGDASADLSMTGGESDA